MRMNTLAQTELRILNEWDIAPLSDRDRLDRRALIEDRIDRQANLMTSRQPLGYWQDMIGDHTFGNTLLARLEYHSHRLTITCGSSRHLRPPESATHYATAFASLPE